MAEDKENKEKKKSGWWECTMLKGPDKNETRVYHHSTADKLEKAKYLKKDKELNEYVPAHVRK